MTDEQKAKCHKIADHYGTAHQSLKAVEEMAELQKELMKLLNSDNGDIDRIIEEIADVAIMVEQMRYCFDTCDIYVRNAINAKLNRQLKRMEDENNG